MGGIVDISMLAQDGFGAITLVVNPSPPADTVVGAKKGSVGSGLVLIGLPVGLRLQVQHPFILAAPRPPVRPAGVEEVRVPKAALDVEHLEAISVAALAVALDRAVKAELGVLWPVGLDPLAKVE